MGARRKSVNKYRRKKVSGKKKARKNRRKRGGNNGFLYDENDYIYGGSDTDTNNVQSEQTVFEEQSESIETSSNENSVGEDDFNFNFIDEFEKEIKDVNDLENDFNKNIKDFDD